MRWIFLLLLLANIGYVAWELRREMLSQPEVQLTNPNVASIVLLSELGIATAVEEPMVPSDQEKEVETDDTDELKVASTELVEKATDAAVDQKSAVVPEPEAVPELKQSEPGPEPVSESVPEPEIQKSKSSEVAKAESLPVPEPAVIAQPAADQCFTLGPFSDLATLRKLTREIKDYVIEASFRSAEEQEQTKFRVYLKSAGSMKKAKALTRELVNKGIKDYFIISSGPNKYGVSLGYFSNKERAYRHAARVKKAGFDAIAEPVFRNYTIYWLDYRIKAGKEIPQKVFDDLLEKKASRLSRSCA